MTPEEGAWVRANAWLPKMRRQVWGVPGGYSYDAELAARFCACETDVCWQCARGAHKFCSRRRIKPQPEWWIDNRPLDYIKPTAVWYADRACHSLCPCECPPPRPLPMPSAPPASFAQLDLLEVM